MSYANARVKAINDIADIVATLFNEYYSDGITETYINPFIDNLVNSVKREAQNRLYEIQEEEEEE